MNEPQRRIVQQVPVEKPHKIDESRMSDSRLLIQYDINEPVELTALADAFSGISRQYANFVGNFTNSQLAKEEVSLYVTKIESNCIQTELAPYVAFGLTAIQVIDWHNALIDFSGKIDSYFKFFKSKTGFGVPVGKRNAEDFRDFLAAVAEKKDGAIKTEVVKYDPATGNKTSALKYTYIAPDIKEAYEGVNNYLKRIESQDANIKENVLLYLPQLNVDSHKSSGRTADKGVIESISTKPLPVYWPSELDSRRVKGQSVNPHKVSYIVDVSIGTRNGIPTSYSVLNLKDIIEEDNESQRSQIEE